METWLPPEDTAIPTALSSVGWFSSYVAFYLQASRGPVCSSRQLLNCCLFQTILSASFLTTPLMWISCHCTLPSTTLITVIYESSPCIFPFSPWRFYFWPPCPFWHAFVKIPVFPIFSNTLVSQCLDLYFPQDLVSILPQPVIPMVKTDIKNTIPHSPTTTSYLSNSHLLISNSNNLSNLLDPITYWPHVLTSMLTHHSLPNALNSPNTLSFFPTYLTKPQFWLNPTLAFTFLYYVSKHGGNEIQRCAINPLNLWLQNLSGPLI